jgi:hypothetical protein
MAQYSENQEIADKEAEKDMLEGSHSKILGER